MDNSLYTVSVVVPTYNRADLLKRCIESLIAQNFPKDRFEIVIVDDGSTDNTSDVVKKLQEEISLPVIKYFRQENKGPGAVRNLGIKNSQGPIIAFTEDDVIVDKNWIKAALPYFKQPDVAGVDGLTKWEGVENLRLFSGNDKRNFIPCNIFYRKAIIEEIGGFDSRFYNSHFQLYFREDSDLAFSVLERNWKIVHVAQAVVTHPALHHSFGNVIRSTKRYYFDPLLYKKHKILYRRMIEPKKIGPLKFTRPFHYLCSSNVFSVILALFSLIFFKPILFIGIGIYIISLIGIIYRFINCLNIQGKKHIYKIPVYLMTPFVYIYWFVKGCIHFKVIPW
jgi:glycosyltransferase involved in cell wall biosynthesis